LPVYIMVLLAKTCTLKSKKEMHKKEMLAIWISSLICALERGHATLLVRWGYRADRVDVVGHWVQLHSQFLERCLAWMAKKWRRLARHTLSQTWVPNG
jgi:hypothetical protein